MRRSRAKHHAKRRSVSRGLKQGSNADALLLQAQEAHRRGHENEAARYFHQSAIKIGNQPQLILSMAQRLEQKGTVEAAIALLDSWVRGFDGSPVVHLYLANLLFQEAHTEEALDAAKTVLARSPTPAAGCLASLCCEHLLRLDDAKHYAEMAISMNPEDPQAVITLAHVEFKSGHAEKAIPPLNRILQQPDLHAQLRSKAWHELGMIYESMKDSARAYDAFTHCGTHTKQSAEYARININRPIKLINQYCSVCSTERFTQGDQLYQSSDQETPQLVFLIGFPRSGTTMTEQILCAHGSIYSADERPFLHQTRIEALRMTDSGNDAGRMLTQLKNEDVTRLRTSYFKRLLTALGESVSARKAILIDKLPLNLIDLPFILRVFPDCRLIVALRDPRDVCLSCFMQDFRLNSEMAHFLTLPDTARFYEVVMSFYLQLRPLIQVPHIEIRYEDTVADLTTQSQRLTEFLGVPWEENMLQFHEQAQQRQISTPSYEAVRKPINRQAVARWKRYEKYFGDVLPNLQRFIDEFGYE